MTIKSRDHLTATTDHGKIELHEADLNRVVGGAGKKGEKPLEFLKIKLTQVFVTSPSSPL
jgi:hypothetical protein